MKYKNLQEKIENIDLDNLSEDDVLQIETTIKELDNGNIRVVNNENGEWSLNEWVRDAILLFFSIRNLKEISANDLIYYDKLEPKKNYKDLGIRVVPPGVVRYGAFCEPGVVVMPGFVNIGAYVGSGTMVDTCNGWILCADWSQCTFIRRSRHWRSSRATRSYASNY